MGNDFGLHKIEKVEVFLLTDFFSEDEDHFVSSMASV